MVAVLSSQTESVRAALVYQAVALSDALKLALSGAGIVVVVEVRADTLDRDALDAAAPQVFVVNLDPDLEDHLDELTEVLDGFSRPVIFNDASASSGLSGWDQARWARHLSSKIKGEVDAHPPRPAGATFIPPVERKIVQIAAPRSAAVDAPILTGNSAAGVPQIAPVLATLSQPKPVEPESLAPVVPSEPISPPMVAAAVIDVDALFADLLPEPVRAPQAPTVELPVVKLASSASKAEISDSNASDFGDFGLPIDEDADFDFDLGTSSSPAAVNDNTLGDFEEPETAGGADLDELWGESTGLSMEPTATPADFGEFDPGFDGPLDGESLADFELPEAPIRQVDTELTDLDALFRELAPAVEAQSETPAADAQRVAPPRDAEIPSKSVELKAPPMSWSLEPLDGEGLADVPVPTGRAQFKVGQEATTVVLPVPAKATVPAASAPLVAESDNDLAAFDFFFEPAAAAPAPSDINAVADKARAPLNLTDIPDFGLSLDPLDALEDSAPPVVETVPQAVPPTTAQAETVAPLATPDDDLGGFDFNFDNFDDSKVGTKTANQRGLEAAALADLDGLFADIEAPPVVSDVPNLDRVWILGASIGGPEAVRSFLAGLKKHVASAFILAQHMGSEFLDLMIGQLAKASPLPVKVAQVGDKLQNGAVLVAPVGKRLTVDAQGRVQLGEMASDMPYSPSIDQIMFDMADRFGPRCSAVIFSGMASDAIEGAKYIASKGGRIWVQDPATCVISSMIDGAQAAGVVSYVGSPEQLSEHLQAHLA